ncbi:hypothetical protein HY933_04495 [Candidatus Falkowbacteria bacterium]|nr:hypothetical protein [Candidatus Falkowbacteria bacterium]
MSNVPSDSRLLTAGPRSAHQRLWVLIVGLALLALALALIIAGRSLTGVGLLVLLAATFVFGWIIRMFRQRHFSRWGRIGAMLGLLVGLGGFGLLLWRSAALLLFLLLFPSIADRLQETVMNGYLAALIGVIVAVALAIVWTQAIRLMLRGKAAAALVLLGLGLSGYYLNFFLFAEEPFVNFQGEPLKCYSNMPRGGVEFISCRYRRHPIVLTEVQPVTPELMYWLEKSRQGETLQRVTPWAEMAFFSPVDGAPRYWYHRHGDGRLEIFNGPGYHPQLQALLQPVDAAVAAEIFAAAKQEDSEKFVLSPGMVVPPPQPAASLTNAGGLAEVIQLYHQLLERQQRRFPSSPR